METLKDRLLYDYDPYKLPELFSGLFGELKSLHTQGKVVPWLNLDSIAVDDDNKAHFVNTVPAKDEGYFFENTKALAKVMIGCYLRQGNHFNDLSLTEDDWFITNLDTIFSCFNYEDFDKEYFYGVLVEHKNYYYSDYLNRKRQSEKLSGVGKTEGLRKVLINPNAPAINESYDEDKKLDISARMHSEFSTLLIGISIAVIAVITILIILLN